MFIGIENKGEKTMNIFQGARDAKRELEIKRRRNMKTKEEIRESIILDLEKAWENQNEARYWLEKIPVDKESDYDDFVNEMIHKMVYHINHNDRDMFELDINDLVEHYEINQENYNFY